MNRISGRTQESRVPNSTMPRVQSAGTRDSRPAPHDMVTGTIELVSVMPAPVRTRKAEGG